MAKALLFYITATCSQATYRRANVAFVQGDNHLTVDEQQLERIKQDPFIQIQSIESAQATQTQGRLGDDHVGDDVTDNNEIHLDDKRFDQAPPELMHFIITLHLLNQETPLTKAPKCDDLACEFVDDDGKTNMVKPSAQQRDDAWAWYQANVVKGA